MVPRETPEAAATSKMVTRRARTVSGCSLLIAEIFPLTGVLPMVGQACESQPTAQQGPSQKGKPIRMGTAPNRTRAERCIVPFALSNNSPIVVSDMCERAHIHKCPYLTRIRE